MRTLNVLFISVLLGIPFFVGYADNSEKEPVITRTFPASSIKEVEVITSGGSLTLTGSSDSKATVEVYVSRNNRSSEKIKQNLDDNRTFEIENYIIDINVENGKLYVAAKPKKNLLDWIPQGFGISFKISVPNRVNSNLQTRGGSIRISHLSGSQNFKTNGGSLMVENVSGNIVGMTSGGSITVTDSKDNINLKTSGGSITAKNCSGNIRLKTSGGSLRLNDLTGDIHATTSGGSINANNINGTLKTGTSGGSVRLSDISGNIEAQTSGGSMTVKIASVSDYVKLTNNGNLTLSLPDNKGFNLNVKAGKVEIASGSIKDFRGNMERKSIEGTVGGGGPEINVKSSLRVRLSFE